MPVRDRRATSVLERRMMDDLSLESCRRPIASLLGCQTLRPADISSPLRNFPAGARDFGTQSAHARSAANSAPSPGGQPVARPSLSRRSTIVTNAGTRHGICQLTRVRGSRGDSHQKASATRVCVLTFALSWGGFVLVVGPSSLVNTNWQAEGKFLSAVIVMLAGRASRACS